MKRLVVSFTVLFSLAVSQIATAATADNQPNKTTVAKNHASKQQALIAQAKRIQSVLATGNYSAITQYIHPTKGVRFSMYALVSDEDKVFSRQDYRQYLQQSKIRFTWGSKDGSGEEYIVPLPEYLKDWVKARDFSRTSVSVNAFQRGGNSLNNLTEIYPKADFVEFYYKGTKKYSQMDWRVLRLVFENYQGKPYLVGVVTDEWTI